MLPYNNNYCDPIFVFSYLKAAATSESHQNDAEQPNRLQMYVFFRNTQTFSYIFEPIENTFTVQLLVDGMAEPLLDVPQRLPSKRLKAAGVKDRLGDGRGDTMGRIVGNVEDDMAPSHSCREFCQLADGDIGLFVGDIVGFAVLTQEEDMEEGRRTIDHIGPGAEGLALALEDDVLATLHIADELRIDTVVRLREARSIDVGGTRDDNLDMVLGAIAGT